jgi:GT2 family glycosyltransferase
MAELEFPRVDRPIVSIVMVTRNDIDWAPRALRACLEHTEPCYELIVVDNGSKDGTPEFLTSRLAGAKVLVTGRNRGFGVGNNLGAGYAVGKFLLFLNSDALVHPGWLLPLLTRTEEDETVAAVGPRLLNLDGSLQSAGALLSRAGATLAYGKGDDPNLPEYGFSRAVDYSSGACLLLRRSTFNEVGGFDPAFGLAYFEDADLCLTLWQHGHRVVYEPRSSVTHVGGGGSTPTRAVLQLAVRNRSLFERRWRALLASYPLTPLTSKRRILAARDARCSERVLVLGHQLSAETVASTFLSARVTVAGLERDGRTLWAQGIEVLGDAEEVFRERRFHYDAVIGDASTLESLDELLTQTQPQAARIRVEDFVADGGIPKAQRLIKVVAPAGIAESR